MRRRVRLLAWALLLALLLTACGGRGTSGSGSVRIVLEEGEGFTAEDYTRTVMPGQDAAFTIQCADGYTVDGVQCRGEYTLEPTTGGRLVLTVTSVRYSTVVSLVLSRSDDMIRYDPNDGSSAEPVELPVSNTHQRWNTASDLFRRPGWTQTGWNTEPDGTGTAVGLGSRIDPAEDLTLYAQWSPWISPDNFTWTSYADGVSITGYTGDEAVLTVPGELDGLPVRGIASGAFANASCATVILPDSLYTLEDGAFQNAAIQELYLFDNIRTLSDASFDGCEDLTTLHLNAIEKPVFSASYYDTFPDKMDRLRSLRDRQKIVLFGGSSVRFGFDSPALDAAFPDYDIVNLGVFAYTNAKPELDMIRAYMGAGDILIHTPEFDISEFQFCTTDDIEFRFFNMVESDYDLLTLLDLRDYGAVFTPLEKYLTVKDPMAKKQYSLSASSFDEDGNPTDTPTYNEYGDYVLYRPNASSALPVYGDPVHYTVTAFPKGSYLDPLNRMYQTFLDKGVSVYFAYAPRNAMALSEDSTPEARAELDRYFRENLTVPVLTDIEDSLWSGVYLYGTDNHLTTEGAATRTEQMIAALREQLARESR